MKTYKIDDIHDKLLKEMCSKWRMKGEDLLEELIREAYSNSKGGRARR